MQLAEYTVRIIADDTIDAGAARQALEEVAGPAVLRDFIAQRIAGRPALAKVRAIAVLRGGGLPPADVPHDRKRRQSTR